MKGLNEVGKFNYIFILKFFGKFCYNLEKKLIIKLKIFVNILYFIKLFRYRKVEEKKIEKKKE